MSPDRTAAARDLLAFYLEAGVDALLAEEPRDRLRPEEAAEPAGVTTSPVPTPSAPTPPRVG
ncbi:uracil-DNA glycosylase, partial [Rhodoplanes sp. SY1]